MDYDLFSRVGKFTVSTRLIEQSPDVIMKALSSVIITRCECVYYTASFEYIALSRNFDKVPEGEMIPMYTFETDSDGNARFERIDK